MKKFLLTILMLLMLIPSLCFAVEPTIKSDTRTFNPLKGIYDLQGHVFVQFPAHDTLLITLSFGEMSFKCDKVDVYHSDRTAYVEGNCNFQDTGTTITADKGSYCWKTKLASFQGNVKVNGQPHAGDIGYNVITKKLIEPTNVEANKK